MSADVAAISVVVVEHLRSIHAFYGDEQGVRFARKHIGWYLRDLPQGDAARRTINAAESPSAQLALLEAYFDGIAAAQATDRIAA